MADVELRLRDAALVLDAEAPVFDPAALAGERRRRGFRVGLAAVVVVTCVATAPIAVSALRDAFGVESVPELGPPAPGVAPPFLGRQVPASAAVWTIRPLGLPDAAYVRDDVVGGMTSVVYGGGRILLTQWPATALHAQIAVVPVEGTAERVETGALHGLWLAGRARGTFTLTGADYATHRETFEVSGGALLWQRGPDAFLLLGAGSKDDALRLAQAVGR